MDINYSNLNNDKLYTFSKRVYEILSPAQAAEMGVQLYFDQYVLEYNKYKKAMLKLKEALKILGNKDRRRDKDGINLRNHVKNYTNHPDEEVAKEGEELLKELDRHGTQFYKKSYEDQTAILEYIFHAIDTRFVNFIARIHADEWYGFLKASQEDFENTRNQLTDKEADTIDEESPSQIRPDLINAMRELLTFMPLIYKVNKNKELGKAIKQIEAEIKRF